VGTFRWSRRSCSAEGGIIVPTHQFPSGKRSHPSTMRGKRTRLLAADPLRSVAAPGLFRIHFARALVAGTSSTLFLTTPAPFTREEPSGTKIGHTERSTLDRDALHACRSARKQIDLFTLLAGEYPHMYIGREDPAAGHSAWGQARRGGRLGGPLLLPCQGT
jgi:hypothetical protein